MTPFTLTFKAKLIISMVLEDLFLLLHFFNTVQPHFCPSIFVFTRPNDGWTGLYIKLCLLVTQLVKQLVTHWSHNWSHNWSLTGHTTGHSLVTQLVTHWSHNWSLTGHTDSDNTATALQYDVTHGMTALREIWRVGGEWTGEQQQKIEEVGDS